MPEQNLSPPKPQPKSTFIQKYRDDIMVVLVFYALTLFLFRGIVFNNAVFSTEGDTVAAQSWSQAGKRLSQQEKATVSWMPYIFSGLPAMGSLGYIPVKFDFIGTFLRFVFKLLFFGTTMSWLVQAYFFGGVCTYLFLRHLKLSVSASAIGALVFMFNPAAIGLAQAGHGSKLLSLTYLPLIILLTHLLFERRSILTFALFAAAVGTVLLTNHVQMAYYVFLVTGSYWLWTAIRTIKTDPKRVARQSGLFWGGIALGFCMAAFVYLTVYQYSPYSIRGGGDPLTGGSGLAYDYATHWSFHPLELLTFFSPAFFGLESPYYWGWMPFTITTNYLGLLPIFLSFMALTGKRNFVTWFFFGMSLLVVLMSFGKHFDPFYQLLFHYLPFFNRFRTPVMILTLLPFFTAVLSAYGLTVLLSIFENESKIPSKKLQKNIVIAGGIGVGLIVAIGLIGFIGKGGGDFLGMFVKPGEMQKYSSQQLAQLKELRLEMFAKDLLKFFLLAVAIFGAIFMYVHKILPAKIFGWILGIIFVIDIFIVDSRYINPQPGSKSSPVFAPNATVQFLQREAAQYRVFPVGQLAGDNSWMYHQIQTIMGYSPAKLKIYQDLLDCCLYQGSGFNRNVLNMLNVKYLIVPGRLPEGQFKLVKVDHGQRWLTYENSGVLPRAFFVDSFRVLKEKEKIFDTLRQDRFNPGRQAILEEMPADRPQKSDRTSVTTLYQRSQEFSYQVYTQQKALLVFSEVYYPAGWKATIDGIETRIYKTNYLLRSVVVPPGEHTIVMKFDPAMVKIGYWLSCTAWGILIIVFIIGGVQFLRRKNPKPLEPES